MTVHTLFELTVINLHNLFVFPSWEMVAGNMVRLKMNSIIHVNKFFSKHFIQTHHSLSILDYVYVVKCR